MNIFGIGLPEMAVIAAIALIVFGPKRLPEMGKTLGRTLKGFQSASQEFEQEFRSALRTEEEVSASSPPPAVLAPSSPPPSPPLAIDPAPAEVVGLEGVTTASPPPSA
ncbi:MAG: TatA/E family twin arginine-targeting protein translocase [Cyanobacteriota bacterium]